MSIKAYLVEEYEAIKHNRKFYLHKFVEEDTNKTEFYCVSDEFEEQTCIHFSNYDEAKKFFESTKETYK